MSAPFERPMTARRRNQKRAYVAALTGEIEHASTYTGGPVEVVTSDGRTIPARQFLAEAEAEIRAATHRAIAETVRIGELLEDIKCLLGHGCYELFVKTRLRWSLRTA